MREMKMRQYWWVNHKQTHTQEINGEFLWSPKAKANGIRNQFYTNMRLASPGDYVLSYADGKVSYVGTVTEFALSSAKPIEFGKAGDAWGVEEGWLLPVTWRALKKPVSPKNFIVELGVLLPEKYSPIRPSSGDGNQGAYLASISFVAFQKVLEKTGIDLDLAFASIELASLFGNFAEQLDEAIERQLEISPELSATEKSQVIKARRGQGLFRANVQSAEQECRLTGVDNAFFLIASHIKPWRSCDSSHERLDRYNGLLLTPHVDLLFDRGLISFEDTGVLLISPKLDPSDMERLGLGAAVRSKPRRFRPEQCVYLDYHRRNVFVAVV